MSKKKDRRRRQTRAKKQKGPSLLIPIIVGVVVLAIIVGAIISIEGAQPATAGEAGSDLGLGNTAQPLDTRSIPYPDVPRISPSEAQQKSEQGQAVLVDVRSKALYDAGHAAGAISIPEAEMTARLDELPQDQEIILYCTWSQEQQSARVAQDLISRGFTNIRAMLGGFDAWQQAGYPVETTAL